MPEETALTPEIERDIVHFPMRVQPVVNTRAASLNSLIALAKDRAPDPAVFAEADPYVFSGIASTDSLDSYFTRMDKSSLENYAAELEAGIPLQTSHETRRLNVGRSLTGRFIRKKGELPSRAEADFFMVAGSEIDGLKTDDIFRNIQAGVLTDLSIGMSSGRWLCDLCGLDYLRGGCVHWLGYEFEVEGKEGRQLCTATIHDGHLAEVSLVFAGSTPGAAIQKVIRAIEAGHLPPERVQEMEARYRVKLPLVRHFTPGVTLEETHKENRMAEKPNGTAPEPNGDLGLLQARANAIESALTDIGHPAAEGRKEPATLLRELGAELVELRPLREKVTGLETKVAELTPQAEDGVAYRTALRAAVEKEYVRARGDKANVAAKAELWDRASIVSLRAELTEYGGEGDLIFQGGRQTTDGEQSPQPENYRTPLAAYRA